MEPADITVRGIARGAGHLLLGTVGTALGAVAILVALEPLRPSVYDAFYLAVGPWTAEVTATVLSFTVAGVLAVSLPTLVSVALRRGVEALRPLAAGLVGAMGVLAVALSLSALAGVVGFLATLVAVAGFVIVVPLGLRHAGVWPSGAITFAGGLPVLVLLILLLGFGLDGAAATTSSPERYPPRRWTEPRT